MRQSDWNRFRELKENIHNALADEYGDGIPGVYEFAVNPVTFEVIVVDSYADTPDGWVYESIVDASAESIEECAEQYFDFRR